ncbi:MAG: cytochrome C [Betaproteobacteria bacterium HGW-Betaproteobacteria-3]|nr:MAG: cytochrome C [Betaproteobacteria bacterium HGW-Betaproteobacteria-3]
MSLLNLVRAWPQTLLRVAVISATLITMQAHALPSFARQTGMDCAACHVGGFGPQLTPTGVRFKLTGYTDTDGQPGKVPLSGMAVASWTHTSADGEPQPHLKTNNNLKLDEASIFLAGRMADHIGVFIQGTHNGVDRSTSLDQTDLRYARTVEVGGKDTVLGLSLNNNPGVQDPSNTLPVWSFPFVSSPAGVGTGESATLLNGGLEGRVTGASVYTLFNNSLYGELGTYRSMSPSTQRRLGLGEDLQRLGGNAYWRLGWMKDQKSQAFHLGLFGWNASLQPDRTVNEPNDKYRDIGIDGSYQFLGTRRHIMTLNGSYIRERKTEGLTAEVSRLRESRLNASYHFNQTWGGSVGLFSTRGTDPAATTTGQLLQADWTPWGKEGASAPGPLGWANLRLGAQYWIYNKFNGESIAAKDHNTLYLFAWTSF